MISRKISRPTKESIRSHWKETESGKSEPRDDKAEPERELYHYMAASIFAIQMRLENIARSVEGSKEPALRNLVLAEKAKAERELDLCGEILEFTELDQR